MLFVAIVKNRIVSNPLLCIASCCRFYIEINRIAMSETSRVRADVSCGIVHAIHSLFYLIRSVRINLDIVFAAAVDIGGR